MMTSTSQALNPANSTTASSALAQDQLYIYFVLAYLAQGISSQFGLIAQPVQFFLMKSMALSAAGVSLVAAAMMLPWILKPLYGVLSDTMPLFGYRRKSYLVAAHVLAVIGLCCVSATGASYLVLAGLLLIAFAMSLATALMLGLAAEKGNDNSKTGHYVTAQSFYYYFGNIAAVLIGGFLCQSLLPAAALRFASLLAVVPVLALSYLSIRMVHEHKTSFSTESSRGVWRSIKHAIRERGLWLVGLFAACWNFTPSFGVPLYFHESNNLVFEQSMIGQLSAWNALGMMIGAVVYRDLIKRLDLKPRLYLVISLWAVSIFSYVWLSSPLSGYFIEIFRGCCNTVEILCLYELAACCCNSRNAVSIMALILAARNIANELGTLIGGSLFTYAFDNQYFPLVFVGMITPVLSAFLVPHMVRNRNRQKSLDMHNSVEA